MASNEDFKKVVELGLERKLLHALKKENVFLNTVVENMKKFWNMPEDLKARMNESDSLPESAHPAFSFANEKIVVILKLKNEMEEKLTTLEICLLAGDPLPTDIDSFDALVSEIKKIRDDISRLMKEVDRNQDVRAFRQLMKDHGY